MPDADLGQVPAEQQRFHPEGARRPCTAWRAARLQRTVADLHTLWRLRPLPGRPSLLFSVPLWAGQPAHRHAQRVTMAPQPGGPGPRET